MEQQDFLNDNSEGKPSANKKFVPTCNICGEKHWPFHPLVPCINLNKVKAKAKEEKKALLEAQKKAESEARAKAHAEKNAISEAKEMTKYEARMRAEAEKRLEAADDHIASLRNN